MKKDNLINLWENMREYDGLFWILLGDEKWEKFINRVIGEKSLIEYYLCDNNSLGVSMDDIRYVLNEMIKDYFEYHCVSFWGGDQHNGILIADHFYEQLDNYNLNDLSISVTKEGNDYIFNFDNKEFISKNYDDKIKKKKFNSKHIMNLLLMQHNTQLNDYKRNIFFEILYDLFGQKEIQV